MPQLELTPDRTALVAIDLQKGVTSIATEPRSPREVVAATVRIADALRAKGGLVVWVRVAFSGDGGDALKPILDAPSGFSGARPADWTDLVPELGVQARDLVVTKKQWGAFTGTELDLQLRRRGIDTILLTGIATCYGVESTARFAYELGYQQVFIEDALACRTAAGHAHCLNNVLARIGRIRSGAETLAALV
jgi:nicotinamidase-related amidase